MGHRRGDGKGMTGSYFSFSFLSCGANRGMCACNIKGLSESIGRGRLSGVMSRDGLPPPPK